MLQVLVGRHNNGYAAYFDTTTITSTSEVLFHSSTEESEKDKSRLQRC